MDRPTTLAADERRAFEGRLASVGERLLDHVAAIVADLPEPMADRVYEVAFEGGGATPKRRRRPKPELGLLVAELSRAAGPDDEPHGVRFAVAAHEYYDLIDDVIDGDVATDRREVLVASQSLLAVAVRLLGELGSDATAYWSRRATRLTAAPAVTGERPTFETYRERLDHEAEVFGSLTGTVVVAAGGDDDRVSAATELGRDYFLFEQLLLDGEQRTTDDDRLNAWRLAPESTVVDRLRDHRDRFRTRLDAFPDDHADLLRPLVAIDLDEWVASLPE